MSKVICMSEDVIFCPNCGQKHTASGRYCENCGTDLEEIILQYKNKQLPIRYQATAQSGPTTQSQPTYQQYRTDDYYDERSQGGEGRGFWDVLFGVLFFWMCCGPNCNGGDCR